MINFQRRPGTTRSLLLTGTAVAGLLLLAGCGSSTSNAQGDGGQQGRQSHQGQQSRQGQGAGRQPGVSGEIAEIDGKTMQVQGTDEQTAVSWTAKTTFTSEVKATSSAVRPGVCVIVRTATGSQTAGAATTVTAQSVNVTPAAETAGKTRCAIFGTGGRRGGGMPSDGPSGVPSGAPSGMPGGGADGRTGNGRGGSRPVSGTVTGVSGSSFTVEVTEPTTGGSTTGGTRTVTVTTSGSTAFTTRKTVESSAAKVGLCATARGRTDSTGALTATSIALSAKTDGGCVGGFGGNRG